MAFSADDKHAYITTLNSESMPGSITVYDRDVNTGILSRSPAPVLGTGKVPYKVIRAANQFLYVTNSLGSKYTAKIGTVSMYRINSDGSISYATSLDSGIVYSGGIFPMAIASDTVGDHVFVQNLYSHNIQAFAIR